MSIKYSPIVSYQPLEVQLRDLDRGSEEFKFVANNFNNRMRSFNVEKIQVVYNKGLWENYYKHWLESKSLEELFVFHGTSLNDPSLIYTNGLRVEKTKSGSLYFAVNSNESNGFTFKSIDCSQIFMCRILVPRLQVSSSIHVIRNNDHHYPQYLISYNSRYN
ncbi:hypothetical protein ACTFIZ_001699 [Dictyostelium cf. discoideum]